MRAQHFLERARPVGLAARQAQAVEQLEALEVGRQRLASLDRAHAVQDEPERALADQRRVQLLERAGGGIARIGKLRQARGGALLVHFGKALAGHVDLAADFEQIRARLSARAGRRGW